MLRTRKLFEESTISTELRRVTLALEYRGHFRRKCSVVGTYHQNKVALTAFDAKRWICGDGIHTLAYGDIDTKGNDTLI